MSVENRDVVGAACKGLKGIGCEPFFVHVTETTQRNITHCIKENEGEKREFHLIKCAQKEPDGKKML